LLALAWLAAGVSTPRAEDESRRVRYHMRERADDLRTIERLLIAGELERAKALAFMLTKPRSMPDEPEAGDMVRAASSLASARSIEDALYATSRIETACARCHAKMRPARTIPLPSRALSQRSEIRAPMAGYEWAIDRMRE
jgi:hypothetical protein